MILTLQGAYGSGKDSVANYLRVKLDNTTHRKIAYYPNQEFKKYSGIDFINCIDRDLKEAERKRFKFYTETMKSIFGEDIWINQFIADLWSKSKKYNHIIISDLRFNIEYKKLQEWSKDFGHDLKSVFIETNSSYTYDRIKEDFLITNKTTKENLYSQVDNMIKTFEL